MDNPETGDTEQFNLLAKAHRVLTDPEKRAAYDAKHREHWDRQWKLAGEARDNDGFSEDKTIRERILSLFYVKRRRDMINPGLGNMELTRLLDCPSELIEFHVWYLREKGWIERLETGQFAITADGVEQVEQNSLQLNPDRLLESKASQDETGEEKTVHQIKASRLGKNKSGEAA